MCGTYIHNMSKSPESELQSMDLKISQIDERYLIMNAIRIEY